jgi:hypothetical protein
LIPQQLAEPSPPARPIIGGELAVRGEFDGVVAILAANRGLCTGTVVSEHVIVTAGHCLFGLTPADNVYVFFGEELDSQMSIPATSFGVHPDFCPDCEYDLFDYGYITVAADFRVPGGFHRPLITQSEWDEYMVAGTSITLVGFGADPNVGGEDQGLGIKRKVDTQLHELTPKGLEFFAGGNARDSCEGDSGGPAFVLDSDGSWRLAGITSRGTDPCGSGGYYGVPYPALCWLREQTGVDLLEGTCQACDCVAMAPPPQEDGCSLGGRHRPVVAWIWLPLVFIARRRRPRTPAARSLST